MFSHCFWKGHMLYLMKLNFCEWNFWWILFEHILSSRGWRMKIYIFKKSGNLFISSGYFHFKSFFLNVKRKKFFALKPRKLIPQQFDLRKGNFNQWKTLNEQWNVFFSAIFQQKTRVFKDSISKKSIYASTFEKSC